MSSRIMRSQAVRAASRPARALAPSSARAFLPARTYATQPDPTKPTSDPAFDSASSKPPGGSGNTFLYILLGTGVAVGGWYYMNMDDGETAHRERKRHEEELKKKGQEALDAGKKTAQSAVREGQEGYDDAKASGKAKLDQARAEASSAAQRTESTLSSYKASAEQKLHDASSKAEQTYSDAKHKVDETTQSWGEWVGSWFGYGKQKADETKKEGAGKVAEGARKVEKEAEKRT
ncbi:hypothetical protein EIP91_000596 [Steccherinum ochraceum]|uniref:Uncharacterized protein n=1 Tax=Steccherinum ochraceum TaxID=92696 RepID=A0A4R0RJM9_9APHY|nr:hypothetical protein EIP91_000596 [Steccherinum ochraceum]